MKKKNNEIKNLFDRFSREMDEIKLPSEEQLLQLIEQHPATKPAESPVAPAPRSLPLSSSLFSFLKVAAVLAVLAFFGWLLWPQDGGHSPSVAQTQGGDSGAVVMPQRDSIAPTATEPVAPGAEQRTATAQKTKPAQLQTVADSVAVVPTVLPVEPQPLIAANDADTNAAVDTLPLAAQPAETDTTTTSPMPERDIDEYPDRPTIDETEGLMKQENNQRALRKRKARQEEEKRKGNFVRKKQEKKDDIHIFLPKQAPSPATPHQIPMGGGKMQILWY